MYISDFLPFDVVNGPGVRATLFVSGCTLQCKGCFNDKAKNFKNGKPFEEVKSEIFKALSNPDVCGLSILGGDPCEPKNIWDVTNLCRELKSIYPNKTIWVWTGRTIEELQSDPGKRYKELLETIDVLVDGRFEEDKADDSLRYRGSSNQKVINLKGN